MIRKIDMIKYCTHHHYYYGDSECKYCAYNPEIIGGEEHTNFCIEINNRAMMERLNVTLSRFSNSKKCNNCGCSEDPFFQKNSAIGFCPECKIIRVISSEHLAREEIREAMNAQEKYDEM